MSTEKEPQKATNAKSLSDALLHIFNGLSEGTVDIQSAQAASSIAGNIIRGNFALLQYKKLTGAIEPINFFETAFDPIVEK